MSNPGDKTVKINELMKEMMKPDYDETIRNELPLNLIHKVGVSIFKCIELNGIISRSTRKIPHNISTRKCVYPCNVLLYK